TGENGEPSFGKESRRFLSCKVLRVVRRGARRSENSNTLLHIGKCIEPLDEFTHYPHYAPWVGAGEIRRAGATTGVREKFLILSYRRVIIPNCIINQMIVFSFCGRRELRKGRRSELRRR